MNYIKALRPINLIIIGITQAYLLFSLIRPALLTDGLVPRLSIINGLLFIMTTLIIAAGGYLINDYFDVENDKINQEAKALKDAITLLQYYKILITVGFAIAFYISYTIGVLHLVLIYPLAVTMLYFYSKTLKKAGLIGNSIVALFTAFVPSILIIAEPELTNQENDTCSKAILIIIVFSIFSLLINLIREIVKDIEDIEGDRALGNKSLPITAGIQKTKVLITFNTIFLLCLIIGWSLAADEYNDFRLLIFNMIFIVAPVIMSILILAKSSTKVEYHKVASLYKWIMLSGMISLVMLINNII